MRHAGNHYAAIAVMGAAFVILGAALAFDFRGFGARTVRFMFSFSRFKRRGEEHRRFFFVGWGVTCAAFGVAALLIGLLH